VLLSQTRGQVKERNTSSKTELAVDWEAMVSGTCPVLHFRLVTVTVEGGSCAVFASWTGHGRNGRWLFCRCFLFFFPRDIVEMPTFLSAVLTKCSPANQCILD
jgi:hypothetical protein